MLGDHQTAPEALRATGTDKRTAKGAQQSERETRRSAAKGCERETEGNAQKKTPKTLRIADLGDGVRRDATNRESSGGGTRTPDTRIMIPRVSAKNAVENVHSETCAAAGAAVDSEHVTIDADLKAIVDRWANLPDEFKAGIVAMVRAVGD